MLCAILQETGQVANMYELSQVHQLQSSRAMKTHDNHCVADVNWPFSHCYGPLVQLSHCVGKWTLLLKTQQKSSLICSMQTKLQDYSLTLLFRQNSVPSRSAKKQDRCLTEVCCMCLTLSVSYVSAVHKFRPSFHKLFRSVGPGHQERIFQQGFLGDRL